jgi:hypothetical protein
MGSPTILSLGPTRLKAARPTPYLIWLAAGVALEGCGNPSSTTEDAAPDEAGITVDLPPAQPYGSGTADNAAKAQPAAVPDVPAEEVASVVVAPPKVEEKKQPPSPPPEEIAATPPPEEEPAPPPPPAAAEPKARRPPLPPATMASTIRRIGYPCPEVTSTEDLGGGAYRITCSSGSVYRGSRQQGRFRFRRWSER